MLGCAAAVLAAGCHAAHLLEPPPPLRAASAAGYAIDVEFAEPLDRVSAEDVTHYSVQLLGQAPVALQSATLIDTLDGRTVQLLIPDWVSNSPDSAQAVVSTEGVRTVEGRSTGRRSVQFETGLSYRAQVSALLAGHCNACHGINAPGGAYRTDSYPELFGPGVSATPDVIAGDPRCLTLIKCKPGNSMFRLGRLSFLDWEILQSWIVIYGARL